MTVYILVAIFVVTGGMPVERIVRVFAQKDKCNVAAEEYLWATRDGELARLQIKDVRFSCISHDVRP